MRLRQWRGSDYLLFRDGVEGPDVVLQDDNGEGVVAVETVERE